MHLKNKFDVGEFAVLAEMEPPKGVDVSRMVGNALRVKGMVDAFVVPEMSNAVMRMSALGGALILQNKGLETVLQVCTRDRNRLALQADLLAAYGCGIINIMAVAGEDPSFGDHHQTRAVYDIDLLDLLQVIQKLANGRDMAGVELAGAPQFLTGSTVNSGLEGDGLEREIEALHQKKEAGVEFFVTPPMFSLEAMAPFLKKVDRRRMNIIPTVLLLKSVGMARYIQKHMPSAHLPGELIQRVQKAPDKARECVAIAADMVARLKAEGFKGVQIATIGWEHKLPEILERI